MNNSARIIKNFIEFQRNVSTEKAIHSLEELKRLNIAMQGMLRLRLASTQFLLRMTMMEPRCLMKLGKIT